MPRVAPKIFAVSMIFLFITSMFLNIAPRLGRALDAFEPNNSVDLETVLHKGNYTGLSISPTDDDYYCIFLAKDENMSVVVWNFTQTPTFFVRDPSRSNTINPVIEESTRVIRILPVKEAGYYHIEITHGPATDYNLNITDITPADDDAYEPNNAFATAQELSVGASYINFSLWDEDYFKVNLAAQANLTISMNRTGGSQSSFSVALYATDNVTLLDSNILSFSGTVSLVLFNASDAGSYCLVVSYEFGAWGNYSLAINPLGDDAKEPNDDFSTAALLAKDTSYSALALYDDDYYNVSLAAGDDVFLILTRSGGAGMFTLSFFAPDQTTVLASISGGSGSFMYPSALNVPTSGDYTLKVNGTVGARGNYSLSITLLRDDAFEPNNAFVSATPLVKNMQYSNLAYLDDDFYNLTLAAGDNLSVTFTPTIPGISGYLSFSLYAPDQATLLSTLLLAPSQGGMLSLLSAPSSGSYYIRVNGSVNAWENYSLALRDIYDDVFEDNDAFGTATPLAKDVQYANLALIDDDIYNVTLALGENLSVKISRSSGSGTFECSLLAPDQSTVLLTMHVSAGSSGELLLLSAATPGDHSIRVHRLDAYTGNYSLLLRNLFDDAFEDNDVLDAGVVITKGPAYSNLALFDDDYYNITLAEGDNLSIVVTRSSSAPGQFFMHFFAPDFQLLFSKLLTFDSYLFSYGGEFFLTNVTVAGTYSLLVNKTADGLGNYSVLVRDLPDDVFEPNDAAAAALAAPLSKGSSYKNLALFDEDYYAVPLVAGANLSTAVLRSGQSAVFNIFFFDTDATSLLHALNLTSLQSGSIVFFAPADGTYFLKVNGTAGSSNNYSIALLDAIDDVLEQNDDLASAATLVNGTTTTDLYYLDDDYYNVSLLAGGDFSARIYRPAGFGVFVLTLLGPDGAALSNASCPSLTSRLVFYTTVPVAGPYTLKVNGSAGAWGTYTLVLGAIADDAYEQNDDFAHAPALVAGITYPGLQLFDADFFSYVASAGEYFRVQLSGPYDLSTSFNLTIYAPDQTTILCQGAYSYTMAMILGGGLVLCVPNAAGGTYYLKVNGTNGLFASYSLFIGPFTDDSLEDNDDPAHALPRSPYQGQVAGIAIDEDWVRFTLTGDDTAWVYWLDPDLAANLTVDLFAADGVTPLPLSSFPVAIPLPFPGIYFRYYSTFVAGDFFLRFRCAAGRASMYFALMLAFNVSQPADLACSEHSTGNTISWTLRDSYPYPLISSTAAVYVNGTPAPLVEQNWTLSGTVSVNVDDFAPGTYEVTLAALLWVGIPRNDTVIVTVTAGAITLSSPDNVTFVIGAAPEIRWDVNAPLVGTTFYNVSLGATELLSGSWVPGSTINCTPSSLGVGVHVLLLNLTDGLGNWTADEIQVTVLNNLALSRPADLAFVTGTTGNSLAWTPTAAAAGTTSYDVLVDGAVVTSGTWTAGTAISFSCDALAVGTHNVKIIVRDGLGTTLQDEVVVTVGAAPGFPIEFVLIIAAAAGAFGAVYYLRRRKRRGFYPL